MHHYCTTPCTTLGDRFREVLLRRLQVVLQVNAGAVAEPVANDVSGEFVLQLRLSARSQVVEARRPGLQAGSPEYSQQLSAEVRVHVSIARDNEPRLLRGKLECLNEKRLELGKQRDRSPGLALAFGLLTGNGERLAFPVDMTPLQGQHFGRRSQAPESS